jgi:adenylylsulfate kinase-like enzyme
MMPVRDGQVIWLTGLSGAGKSAVAGELVRQLTADGRQPIRLDGDELRAALDVTGTFDLESRRRLAFVYARLCRLLANQGHLVVCATIALFHDVQRWNRENLPNYVEVFLDVPMDELRRRNSRGVYGPATDHREVVGLGIAAQFPRTPDLTLRNFGSMTPIAAAGHIRQLIMEGALST